MLLRETGRPVCAPVEISMTQEVLPSMTDTRAGHTIKSSISVGDGEAGVSSGCVMEEGQGECKECQERREGRWQSRGVWT